MQSITSEVIDYGPKCQHSDLTPLRRKGEPGNRKAAVMTHFDELVVRYIETWNETDADKRRELIDRHWAPDARYVDPLGEAVGPHAIDAMIAAVQDQFPGMAFTLAGPVDSHHEQARFGWNLGAPGSDPLIIGFDVAERDSAGRLTSVLGFLDKVPA